MSDARPLVLSFEIAHDWLVFQQRSSKTNRCVPYRGHIIRRAFSDEIEKSGVEVPNGLLAYAIVIDCGHDEHQSRIFFADRRLEKMLFATPGLPRILLSKIERLGCVGALPRRPALEI